MLRDRVRRLAVAAVLPLATVGALTACEVPTILWVDTPTDAPDAAVGDGSCATAAGGCSLRAAIQEANAAPGPVRVELGEGEIYTLTVAGSGEGASATGDLDVTGTLTIAGNGSTIDAAGIDRVLELIGSASLTLQDVTITGGYEQFAGGIRINAGTTAAVTRSTVTGNTAYGFMRCYIVDYILPQTSGCSSETDEFGYAPLGGTPALVHRGEGGGAGIWNRGTLVLSDSTVSANVIPEIPAMPPGEWGSSTECRTGVGRDVICDLHLGAGLLNYGHADLVNVTFSGNTIADGFGAAIAEGPWVPPTPYPSIDPSTTLAFVTIADNTSIAPTSPNQAWFSIRWPMAGSAVVGTVRAGATVIDGEGTLCSTPLAPLSLGANTASDSSCFDPSVQPTDRNGVAPALGPLAPNGGPTWTHLPLGGSPLIDSVPACGGLVPTDQRGSARPADQPCTAGSLEP